MTGARQKSTTVEVSSRKHYSGLHKHTNYVCQSQSPSSDTSIQVECVSGRDETHTLPSMCSPLHEDWMSALASLLLSPLSACYIDGMPAT